MVSSHHRPLIGWSEKMIDLRADIDSIASRDSTIMIRGERGTGKELVANEIHLHSSRANGPFVPVNCASLPDTLVETELFGCEKGAFTGAIFKKGRFEQADGGTLFLDEVGELNLMAQPKLLRILETRKVDRVGGAHSIPVNFRLIVATHRDLEEMARTGKFREDLYDRLDQDTIRTPPLRERIDDIPVLAEYLIGFYVSEAKREVKGLSPEVLELFRKYFWPGNVREFENTIRKAVFRGRTEWIRVEDLPFDFAQKIAAPPIKLGNYQELMTEYSRKLVTEALHYCNDHRSNTAKLLGLDRRKLYRLIELHGLEGKSGSSTDETDWI